jgi:hypothetical protein
MNLVERTIVTPSNIDHTKLTAEATLAGLTATAIATLFFETVAALGGPHIDMPATLGRAMSGRTAFRPFGELAGHAAWVLLGVTVAIAFGWLVERRRPQSGAVPAAGFSIGVWLLAQLVALPLAGAGLFGLDTEQPFAIASLTLAATLVYGAVMGTLLRTQVAVTALPVVVLEARASLVPRSRS